MYVKEEGKIWVATTAGGERVYIEPSMANRHGLIAGATGTGKTVTLKVIAESFSEMGVPSFIADIKGDVSGMCVPGTENKHIRRSVDTMGLGNFTYTGFPVRFFDVYGKSGLPVRTTISEMGPELLSRLLSLTDVQAGVLRIIFRVADDRGLLLLDLKDLRAMANYVGEHAGEIKLQYGNVTPQSIGGIQRALLTIEDAGGDVFFGEPALSLSDWFAYSSDGRGAMNILECQELFQRPLLYSTFLLWMLSELYELLPEAGDLDRPKIAFFFDEAHLLFNDAPKALLEKIEQVVRLIRSKGVSVWFITQSPSDIPESVLGQLGNRIQHALRAYTPNEQKALRYAARSFRVNPEFDTERALQEVGVGEAIISVLDAKGVPSETYRANVLPPRSSMNAADEKYFAAVMNADPLRAKYGTAVDRESAYEMIAEEAKEAAEEAAKEAEKEPKEEKKPSSASSRKTGRKKQSAVGRTVSSAANSFGREIGRQLVRGVFGIFRK
ncbi:MAG: DUF853 family protein [Clostridia bacterium]|nr:DUF853 family protein [Clostridia bacterium]